jgi:riboflavin synthase
MFTGLVSAIGTVVSVSVSGDGDLRRIAIRAAYDPATIALGASIACAGPCLTAVSVEPAAGGCVFAVDAAAETLARTTVGSWVAGTRINLERSLKIGDELGGHLVTGHVDGLAEIVERVSVTADAWGASERFTLRAPAAVKKFIAEKGSVCLDGTSLQVTTWGERRQGDRLNLEVDLIARYAARLAEARAG